jgi:hypothetical protein|tara:strand:- start:21 stop:479 length:459 start_codon:yes stop_codon:yes gene_type:complete
MTKLCPRGKAAAKRKFKVYPSAYANAYASKICAGKIKDPSGVKRKDFRGRKPSAMGGRIGYNSGSPRKGVKPGKRPNIIQMTREQKEKRFDTPFRPKGESKMAPKPREIPRAKDKTRPRRAGGGLMAATERLRRQGLRGGGFMSKRAMMYGK